MIFKRKSNGRTDILKVKWNIDDSLVVTLQKQYLIKVWSSDNGMLIHELRGHSDEIYALETHPRDPRILLSAGYDSSVLIWNIINGENIKKFFDKVIINIYKYLIKSF